MTVELEEKQKAILAGSSYVQDVVQSAVSNAQLASSSGPMSIGKNVAPRSPGDFTADDSSDSY